jgi:RNA polymerase sigma factor (sigma-70 family)
MQSSDLLSRDSFVHEMSRSLIADGNHADDVAQEIWLGFLTGPAVTIRHPVAWISAAIRNRFRMLNRGESRRKKREEAAALPEQVPAADDAVAQKEVNLIVAEAVLGLDEPHRSPLLLRFYDNRPNREVAEILGISQDAVQSRMRRALEKVRRELTRKYNGDTKSWAMALAPAAGLTVGASASAASATSGVAAQAALTLPKGVSPLFLLVAGAALIFVGGASVIAWSLLFSRPDSEGPSPGLDRAGVAAGVSLPAGEREGTDLLSAEKTDRIAVTLPAGTGLNLSGRIESRSGGRPIAGARVSLLWPPFEEFRAVCAFADGSFSLLAPLEAQKTLHRCLLSVSAPGYRTLETCLRRSTREARLDVGTFFMDEDPVHRIRIFGPEGEPVSGAVLRFSKPSNRSPAAEKVSDRDGAVEVSDQELSRNRWVPDMLSLHVQAEGMADCFFFRIWSGRPMPVRITMEAASRWHGRILDAETGLGIAAADVRIRTHNRALKYPMEEMAGLCAVTDREGGFSLPRLTLEGGRAFLSVLAPCYFVRNTSPGKFPREIRLERPASEEPCLAVEEGTGLPLGGFRIRSDRDYLAVSDSSGRVRLPVSEEEPVFAVRTLSARRLTDLDDRRFFKGRLDDGGDARETPVLSFVTISQERLTVRVRDRAGRPVAGAIVSIDIDGTPATPREYSDGNGCAFFEMSIPEKRHARVTVVHHNLFFARPSPIQLGPEGGERGISVVLGRGRLFQNIRLVNERAEPLACVHVEGRVRMAGGLEVAWGRITDDKGLFDVTLPPFVDGCIEIKGRPGTRTCFDFEQFSAGVDQVLHIPDQSAFDGIIEGVATDSAGIPLKGAVMRCLLTGGAFRFENRARTDGEGTFSIPVLTTGTYSLKFSPHLERGKWFVAEPRTGVLSGDRVLITMQEYTGVLVHFPSFGHRPECSGLPELPRLESPEGTVIEPRKIIRFRDRALFAGLPDGEMRAVIHTEWGERFESPLFEIKEGASLISMILLD